MISNAKGVNYQVVDPFEYYDIHSDHFSIRDNLENPKKNFEIICSGARLGITASTNAFLPSIFLRSPPIEIHDFYWWYTKEKPIKMNFTAGT
jgi:hypothetical protein